MPRPLMTAVISSRRYWRPNPASPSGVPGYTTRLNAVANAASISRGAVFDLVAGARADLAGELVDVDELDLAGPRRGQPQVERLEHRRAAT